MLPMNLSPLEVVDVGIFSETLAYKMYDRLGKRVEVPTLQARLTQLKKDEKDHRKTLRAHRKEMFQGEGAGMSEAEIGSRCQMSRLYSRIVLSVEKRPLDALFRILMRSQLSLPR